MKHQKHRERQIPILRLAPEIWKYQAITKLILAALLSLVRFAALALLHSTGRVAVTSGDYGFLFTTWQGLLMIFLFLSVLFLYAAIDLNVKILYSGNLLRRNTESVFGTVKCAIQRMPEFFNIHGIGVVLYAALVSPVVGVGLCISLTREWKIPEFILSVIETPPLYRTVYLCLVLLSAILGTAHIFCLHGALLDNLAIRDARRQSRVLVRRNWWNFLVRNFGCAVRTAGTSALAAGLFLILPLYAADSLVLEVVRKRFVTLFALLLGLTLTGLLSLLAVPYYILCMTRLYLEYRSGTPVALPPALLKKRPVSVGMTVLIVLGCMSVSLYLAADFDMVFPREPGVRIIAHRGGGFEGAENTLSGLETAIGMGVYGSEIDVQRTADGFYIVNHDITFLRTAGVNRMPEEMTLEEVRQLRVGESGEPVPTLEEMLEAARGRVRLFVELKGNTADRRMCDDVVRIIREMGMERETVLISLRYEIIDYLEAVYPEMETAYLAFLAYGDTVQIPCDALGMEKGTVSASLIDAVHARGKRFYVWTPNAAEDQERFLASKADAMITDNVAQAYEILARLRERSDLQRILSRLDL